MKVIKNKSLKRFKKRIGIRIPIGRKINVEDKMNNIKKKKKSNLIYKLKNKKNSKVRSNKFKLN